MRTKTLLLTAALAAAGAASAMAQSVYSVNAVGYINKSIVAGYSIVANQLVVTDNSLDTLIPAPPNDVVTYTQSGGTYLIATYIVADGAWDDGGVVKMNVGEATVFFNSGPAFNATFVGEVTQSVGGAAIVNSLPPGQNLRSSKVPQAGLITGDLKYNPGTDVTTYQIAPDGSTFLISSYVVADGAWDAEPSFGFAEGAYFDTGSNSDSWSRVFTVN